MVRARFADDRLTKIFPVHRPSRAKWKADRPRLGYDYVLRKSLREKATSWEVVKRKALNREGWEERA